MEWYPGYQCQRTKGHKLWDEKSDKNIWRKGERGRERASGAIYNAFAWS